MEITKIVITGGPCAGKTTAMSWIQDKFTSLGYCVLFVPETATELISGGVAPWTCGTNREYQMCQVKLQLYKEAIFLEAAKTMPQDKILLVCDRGVLDNKAYMTEEDMAFIMSSLGLEETALRDDYAGVFHLVTAAKGAEKFYTLSNNGARYETVEEAAALDDKFIHAWSGHRFHRVIGNDMSFDRKMRKLLGAICELLGEPQPLEIQRKYLVEYPDIAFLESLPDCRKVEIIQTYLRSSDGREIRIRQREMDGRVSYKRIEKKRMGLLSRVEVEKNLTQEEYLELLMEADTALHQIRKTRYCLLHKGEYFEVDIYPFWDKQAILEIELNREDEEVILPEFLNVIREVTLDTAYYNYQMAKSIPPQER